MYDDGDEAEEGMPLHTVRKHLDSESSGTTETMPELSSGEMGHPSLEWEPSGTPDEEIAGVYFVVTSDERFVKIGYSATIMRRLVQLRTIGPGTRDARVIGYLPGTPGTEKWLHLKFARHRDSGEWFHYADEVKEFSGALLPIAPKVKIPKVKLPKVKIPKVKIPKVKIPVSRVIVEPTAEEPELELEPDVAKNKAAQELGKRGAKARMKKLTPEQRSEIARKAGKAGGRGRKKAAKKK